MIRLLPAALAALALAACSSLDQFDIPLSQDGVLRGNLSSLPQNGFPPAWPAGADASREIANQGVEASDITSATLKSATISVVSPANGTLQYLTKFELYIAAPGLPEKRIASQDAAFAERMTTYVLNLDTVELKPYLAAESMSLRPSLEQRSKPSQDLQIRLDLVLHVDLSLVD